MTKRERMKLEKIEERIASGEIINQKCWEYIVELNSYSAEQLDRTALIDADRKYTYRQLFRNWEYYAEVFSALGMTGQNHSRVGILGGFGAEPTIAYFALNMTGASVSLIPEFLGTDVETIKNMIREEGITDLLISDTVSGFLDTFMFVPRIVEKILAVKEELGLSNIIVLHVPLTSSDIGEKQQCENRWVSRRLREIPGVVLMEDLLEQYEASTIVYDKEYTKEDTLIIHTSGTTDHIPKPVPFSDRQVNAAVDRFMHMDMTRGFRGTAVALQAFDISASYGMFDMMYLPLAFGGTVVAVFHNMDWALFSKLISRYRVNILFLGMNTVEDMMRIPKTQSLDMSGLKLIALGGGYLSAENKAKYNTFIKEHGGTARITNGYGLTEAGAACILAPPERDDDAIGYPMPGIKVKIYDEDDGRFYNIEDGPRTGGLYLSGVSVSSGRIDDKVYFETEDIDGEPYLCTYDLVRVNEDGSLTQLGRMNRFFINDEGSRFESGIVENVMASCHGIKECAVVPEYSKAVHDTVPILYITAEGKGTAAEQNAKEAISHTFIDDNLTSSMNLPEAVIITDQLPHNPNGKVDVYTIMEDGTEGERYRIEAVREGDGLKKIQLIHEQTVDREGAPDKALDSIKKRMRKQLRDLMRD